RRPAIRQKGVAAARLRLALRVRRSLLPGLTVSDAELLDMVQPALRQIRIQRLADAADPDSGRPRMDVAVRNRHPGGGGGLGPRSTKDVDIHGTFSLATVSFNRT